MSIPWWGKIGFKIVASRLPIEYSKWFSIGVFRHGRMGEAEYARGVFDFHAKLVPEPLQDGAVCLEIGPGDSLFTAITATQAGFARSILLDAGHFADDDLVRFRTVAKEAGLDQDRIDGWKSFAGALADLHATYHSNGLSSLRELDDASVHFAFSHAVLEHVRKGEYDEFLRELRRVLVPGSLTSHQVDLKDHLAGSLNNLRFSDRIWESRLFSESGFYTNRLSIGEQLAAFERAGFEILSLERQQFDSLPLQRSSFAPQFRDRPLEDLMVHGFHIVARA